MTKASRMLLLLLLLPALAVGCQSSRTGVTESAAGSSAVTETATQGSPATAVTPFELNEDTRDYDQIHVAAELRPDFEAASAGVKSSLTLAPLRDGLQRVVLHSEDCEYSRVAVDGVPANYELKDKQMFITLPRAFRAGERLTLSFEYVTRPTMGLFFSHPDSEHPFVPTQLWTQGEGTDNRHWLPCYDLPDDRLTSELSIVVPQGYKVIANGRPESVSPEPGGVRHHWVMEKEHVSYLISIIAGEFDEVRETMADGPDLYYYTPVGRAAEAALAFGKTPDMMRFFADYTGCAYAWPRYSQTPVWDFLWGGMENTGATTLNMRCLHDERAHLDYSADGLVAHELAHQWFGDLITCRTFDHIWLNEGFATYFTDLYFEHAEGIDKFQVERLANNDRYFSYSPLEKVAGISLGKTDITPGELTSAQYQKGSAVLHMLRFIMGDEAFRSGIRGYLKSCGGKSIDTEPLRAAMEAAHGKSLRWFFDEWVYKGVGYPVYDVTYDWANGALNLTVKQMQPVGAKFPLYSMPVNIGLCVGGVWKEQRVELSERAQTVRIPCAEKPESVVFDAGGWLLKRLTFHKPVEDWATQLRSAPNVINRIEAARALADFDFPAAGPLFSASRNDNVPEVRAEAVEAVSRMHQGPQVARLLDWLADRGSEVAGAVDADGRTLESLELLRNLRRLQHKFYGPSDHFNTLVGALGDDSSKVRIAAIRAIACYGAEMAEDVLVAMLENDDSYYVRAEAALALASPRSRTAFDILARALEQESYENIVRQYVMMGFAVLGDARALPLAAKYSRYEYGGGGMNKLPQAAIDTYCLLQTDRDKTVAFLGDHLRHPYFRCRNKAADWLQRLHAWEAAPALRAAIKDEVMPGVQRKFKTVLKELDPGSAEDKE